MPYSFIVLRRQTRVSDKLPWFARIANSIFNFSKHRHCPQFYCCHSGAVPLPTQLPPSLFALFLLPSLFLFFFRRSFIFCHSFSFSLLPLPLFRYFPFSFQVLVAYALSIEVAAFLLLHFKLVLLIFEKVFYDTEPDWNNIFGVILAMAATAFYFISERDRELKPQGHSEVQGAKYHRILAQ